MHLCFIDTETTGLFPSAGDRVCEIGLLKVDENLQIIERFEHLINPQRLISPGARRVNGISDEELVDAPIFREIADKIYAIVKDGILIGHNILFDYSFMRNEFRLSGIDYDDPLLFDTREAARNLVISKSYGLSTLTGLFGIKIRNRHRAMGDCLGTYELFRYLLRRFTRKSGGGLTVFLERFSFHPGRLADSIPEWLKSALDKQRDVEIEYVSRNNQKTRRVILPVGVLLDAGKLYIDAFCRVRKSRRTFLVDRIARILPEKQPPEN